jgi:hypothetical protein
MARSSPSDRKPAFFSVIAARAFNSSRVDGPAGQAASSERSGRSCGQSLLAPPLRGTLWPPRASSCRDLSVNTLAVRRDAGVTVNRDIGFCHGADSALVSGRRGVLFDTGISPAPATCRRRQPSAPPSAGKTSSIEYQITVLIASRVATTGAPLVTQPSSLFETDRPPAANPHRSTPASVRPPPAVSSLEAAVNGRADALVTYNVRHFAQAAARFGLRLARPVEVFEEMRQ